MATDTLKVLGQAFPAATTLTTLYTVPAATSTVVSTLTVCNQSVTASTFRVSVQIAAAADASKQYLYFDNAIAGSDTFAASLGISLATTDVLKVYSGNGSISFSAFGTELT